MPDNAALILRFDTESAFALKQEPPTDSNWERWIDESLAGVKRIVEILHEFDAPATFFIVGLLLEKAGDRYVSQTLRHSRPYGPSRGAGARVKGLHPATGNLC